MMEVLTCWKCSTENPAAARFCMACGTSLERSCPQCGAKALPQAEFCIACGSALAARTAAARGGCSGDHRRRRSGRRDARFASARAPGRERRDERGAAHRHGPVRGPVRLHRDRRAARPRDGEDARRALPGPARARRSSTSEAGSTSTWATTSWRSSAHRSRTRTTPSARCARRSGCRPRWARSTGGCRATMASSSRCGSASTPARCWPARWATATP